MAEDEKQQKSELTQKLEVHFCEEKKKLEGEGAVLKKNDIVEAMKKCPGDEKLQKAGNTLIQRIDNTLEEEMAQLAKEKDEAVERAKLQMIAETDEELRQLQEALDAR